MTNPSLSIATLVGSRICHDLISPVGAIHNGIELIGMGGPIDTPELTLISDSVTNATARIKFFRIAFGYGAGEQMIGAPEAANTARDAFEGGRLQVTWQVQDDMPRPEVQAAYLAVLCIESALPRGGAITVSHDGTRLAVQGTGQRINFDETLWGPLACGKLPENLRPGHVQFALLSLALGDIGRKITTSADEETVRVRF